MLSSIYRETIILHYYDNLSVKQISKKLNVPEGTVSWRLKVARSKIKEEFEDLQIEFLVYCDFYSHILQSGMSVSIILSMHVLLNKPNIGFISLNDMEDQVCKRKAE